MRDKFIKNKYFNWYFNIINKSKNQVKNDYVEKHHIIPKCMGGTDEPENIVPLTAREHFICHWLLVKIVEDDVKYKLMYALSMMQNKSKYNPDRNLTSRQYEICKKYNSIATRLRPKLTKEQEERRRKNIKSSWDKSPERKKLLSEKTKERNKSVPKSEKTKEKISKTLKGKKHSPERRKNKSKYMRKTWKIIFTNNEYIITENRKLWCKNNGYNNSSLSNLYAGRIKFHKDIVYIEKL